MGVAERKEGSLAGRRGEKRDPDGCEQEESVDGGGGGGGGVYVRTEGWAHVNRRGRRGGGGGG